MWYWKHSMSSRMITQCVIFTAINGPRRAVDQFSVGPVRESSSYRSCASLYTSTWNARTPAHSQKYVWRNTRARTRPLAHACSFARISTEGWRDVDTCTRRRDARYPIAVPLYPANWNFSSRIEFFRENHETPGSRDICDVLGVTLRGRIIHTQCDSSKRGYAADRISAPVWISQDIFPKRNGNANDLSAPRRDTL